MSQKQPTQSPDEWRYSDEFADIYEEIQDEVKKNTPASIIELLATQLKTAREARSRIQVEGSVVRDSKGSVIAHPAIKIEAEATKLYASILKNHTYSN